MPKVKVQKTVNEVSPEVQVGEEADEAVVVVSSLGFMEKDKRFEDIGNGLFKVLPANLKSNEKIVEVGERKFVEFVGADQATYLL